MSDEEMIDAIEDAQSYLPNHAVKQWDNLEEIKKLIEEGEL